ncbi:MAG: FAD-binding oxidoreductase, partial [Rhodobacteraceae bacterium]|nr:FAD-binding oxidoreductase [Paracoccaceae bacterium]
MVFSALNAVTDRFRQTLSTRIPTASIGDYGPRFGEDPRGRYVCDDALLIQPACVDEVATLLKLCNEARVPVVPHGGGTGLVGGQIGHDLPKPVVLSLHRMNTIRDLSAADYSMTAEAGCILEDVQMRAEAADLSYPISIPSRGSCQVGGLMATNAGGSGALRYGSVRDRCLGLEAVFADGSVWSRLEPLHKDNHGYDLRHLLIGSEGTLAVITAATLKLHHRAGSQLACFLVLRDLDGALEALNAFRLAAHSSLAAFELFSGVCLEYLIASGLK